MSSYSYDTLNRLTGLTDFNSNPFAFSYDALGRRTSLTRPNGVSTAYTYDNLSRLLSVMHQAGRSVLDGASYNYDAVGNRTAKTNSLNGMTSAFSYDPIYELQKVTQGAQTPEQYTYDAVGNRLTSSGGSSTYDSSNHLLTSPSLNSAFTYDANGNTTSRTVTVGGFTTTANYSWDIENRLTQFNLPAVGLTVNFNYDPFGRRIQKTSALGTTGYVYDGDNISEELNSSGSSVARYTQGLGIDESLARTAGGVANFYEADGLGSVTSSSSGKGKVAQSYVYDSFGNITSTNGSVTNPFQYTGREFDFETGLYYYRARYYDSSVGRFLSEDPLRSSSGTVDLYQYAENNPISFEDPTGLEACRKPAQCFAQLKYRPVNDWRAKLAGATHAFWYAQGSDGKQFILSSGPTGASGNGSLNVWKNSNVNNGADNTSATTWWNSGISSVNCAGVDKMIQAATRWPENRIPYSWSGPNSNSAAHELGTIGGFNPPAPPGSVGWGAPIPKSH